MSGGTRSDDGNARGTSRNAAAPSRLPGFWSEDRKYVYIMVSCFAIVLVAVRTGSLPAAMLTGVAAIVVLRNFL